MDVNELLAQIRVLAGRLVNGDMNEEAAELAEKVIAMDEWLTTGGYLPQVWQGN